MKMIFYVLIGIVLIAELIIAGAILLHLKKIDRLLVIGNSFLHSTKSDIADILKIGRKISEQFLELSPIWVNEIQKFFIDFISKQSKNILSGFAIFLISKKVEKTITKSLNKA